MASKVVSSRSVEMLSTKSFIRGYHAYMDTWTPVEDEVLRLIPEPTNSVDRNAVAVMKEGQIVGHVPFNLSPIVSLFLRRDVNKAFARVTGGKVNEELDMVLKYRVFTNFTDQSLILTSYEKLLIL